MDHENTHEFVAEFQRRQVNNYMRLTKVFGNMEIKIHVEPYTLEMLPSDMIEHIARAQSVVLDLPMDRAILSAAWAAATDWLVGMVLIVAALTERHDWMFDAAMLQTIRTASAIDDALALMNGGTLD